MTLTDFLLARIAEDEADARAIRDCDYYHGVESDAEVQVQRLSNPARVLAECEAKRRIVEAVEGWQHMTVEDCWYSCAATYGTDVESACCDDGREGMGCDCGRDRRALAILAPLALPYADHPDCREEWRP